jgi:predicted HicB family RNase H-like nuclease
LYHKSHRAVHLSIVQVEKIENKWSYLASLKSQKMEPNIETNKIFTVRCSPETAAEQARIATA